MQNGLRHVDVGLPIFCKVKPFTTRQRHQSCQISTKSFINQINYLIQKPLILHHYK